jgi:hypothetical protein
VREHRFVDEVPRIIRQSQKDQGSAFTPTKSLQSHEIIYAPRSDSSVPSGLDLWAPKDNIYISFLLSSLFLGPSVPMSLMRMQAQDTTSLAQLSIRALSLAYFGRIHHQKDIMDQGVLIYGKALRHLNEVLQDYEKACSLTILSSVLTLEAYEVSLGSLPNLSIINLLIFTI